MGNLLVKGDNGEIGILQPQAKGTQFESAPGKRGCYARPGQEVFEKSCNSFPKPDCIEYDNCYWGTPEDKAHTEPMQPMGFTVNTGMQNPEPKVDAHMSTDPEDIEWDAEWDAREAKRKQKRGEKKAKKKKKEKAKKKKDKKKEVKTDAKAK